MAWRVRIGRRDLWTGVLLLWVGAAGVLLGMRLGRAPDDARVRLDRRVEALRAAVERYRTDHGWYPADPDRDYNSDGRADLLRQQLTGFTRDDGKPAERRDGEFCFGPYLQAWPADPFSGSRAVVVDQDRVRSLERLQRDIAAGRGQGGWYYEARTGQIVPNHGHRHRSAGL